MHVLVSGSTGFIGTAVTEALSSEGHTVERLVRSIRPELGPQIVWDPTRGQIRQEEMEGFDAVIHLAGEPIGERRWTEAQKARIRDSRVEGTQLLAGSLTRCEKRPQALLCASAIGYYGDRGNEILDESSSPGRGFLAEVSQAWEEAAQPAREAGIRVAHCRFGLVLSAQGGALPRMLRLFRLGLGGVLGGGNQYWSWIALADVIEAMHHLLLTPELEGPFNFVSPNPVTNLEFTQALGRALHRPTWFPAPAFALRLLLGEMADPLLLASTRVQPTQLLETGFPYQHPEIRTALTELLSSERQ